MVSFLVLLTYIEDICWPLSFALAVIYMYPDSIIHPLWSCPKAKHVFLFTPFKSLLAIRDEAICCFNSYSGWIWIFCEEQNDELFQNKYVNPLFLFTQVQFFVDNFIFLILFLVMLCVVQFLWSIGIDLLFFFKNWMWLGLWTLQMAWEVWGRYFSAMANEIYVAILGLQVLYLAGFHTVNIILEMDA